MLCVLCIVCRASVRMGALCVPAHERGISKCSPHAAAPSLTMALPSTHLQLVLVNVVLCVGAGVRGDASGALGQKHPRAHTWSHSLLSLHVCIHACYRVMQSGERRYNAPKLTHLHRGHRAGFWERPRQVGGPAAQAGCGSSSARTAEDTLLLCLNFSDGGLLSTLTHSRCLDFRCLPQTHSHTFELK